MDTRRDFLKKAMMFTGAAGMATLPMSIQKALAIDPEKGSTYLDAEHIVILMQENRSFDHTYGTLKGVRGFNDPRAMQLPNNNLVWLQTNANGETYSPFRLDIKDTKITWMGSLPHGRESQAGARNNGAQDNWIEAKKSGDEYAHMPLTMGYYTREDIPFYYSLADAFTVCDQNFCSALSPTDPNRLYFFSGTVRPKPDETEKAYVDNDAIEKGVEWRTFPELLEAKDVSWKVYQNEVTIGAGFTEEEDEWLGNFGDNPLQFFKQYNAKLLLRYVDFLPKQITAMQDYIKNEQEKLKSLTPADKEYGHRQKELQYLQQSLDETLKDKQELTAAKFEQLPDFSRNIHKKAFTVNENDPDQHALTALNYMEGDVSREINIPKGDVLHQFRQDVENGTMPTVSWLAAPQNFSDHPSAPWFGAWYVSETMDILTKNPDVWKKTIFILAYDENDGYYDHVSPFIAPDAKDKTTGFVSEGINTALDHVHIAEDVPGSIGLGFRVPLVIASPWSRGGFVNSQVFDHTSTIQFIEDFLNKKYKKDIKETNITDWRRAVCGDLTSTFRTYNGAKHELPFVKKKPFIESIHNAKFKNIPSNYKALSAEEITALNSNPNASVYMPQQEKGIKPACALPYELYADGSIDPSTNTFIVTMKAGNTFFTNNAAGSPFTIHERNYANNNFKERNYAVTAGNTLTDAWAIDNFTNHLYHVQIFGPNGFYRDFKGDGTDVDIVAKLAYHTNLNNKPTGNAEVRISNISATKTYIVQLTDNSYKTGTRTIKLLPKTEKMLLCSLENSFGWYDVTLKIDGSEQYMHRFTGHVETGKESKTDPLMGMTV